MIDPVNGLILTLLSLVSFIYEVRPLSQRYLRHCKTAFFVYGHLNINVNVYRGYSSLWQYASNSPRDIKYHAAANQQQYRVLGASLVRRRPGRHLYSACEPSIPYSQYSNHDGYIDATGLIIVDLVHITS